jgi:dihydrofolate reductase
MTTGHVFIATSLDGFIAREDGAIDWLVGFSAQGEDHGYDTHMARVDGMIMGRKTFETVQDFSPWPYDKPVLVLSQTLAEEDIPRPLRGKVEIFAGTPEDVMAETARRGWRGAYLDGGVVVQSFLRAGLVKDMVVSRVPVLIGTGRPLFGPLNGDKTVTHEWTKSFPSGLVQSFYRFD